MAGAYDVTMSTRPAQCGFVDLHVGSSGDFHYFTWKCVCALLQKQFYSLQTFLYKILWPIFATNFYLKRPCLHKQNSLFV